MSEAARRVLPVANLREFFRDTLHGALVKQHLAVEGQTVDPRVIVVFADRVLSLPQVGRLHAFEEAVRDGDAFAGQRAEV